MRIPIWCRTAKTGSIPTGWSAGLPDTLCRTHRLQWLHFPVAQQKQRAGSQVERFVDSDSTACRQSRRTAGQPGRPDGGLDWRGLEVSATPSASLLTETGRALLYCLVFRSFGNFVWDESCSLLSRTKPCNSTSTSTFTHPPQLQVLVL